MLKILTTRASIYAYNMLALYFLAKGMKNTCEGMTVLVKLQVVDLQLYGKCNSSAGVLHVLYLLTGALVTNELTKNNF